MSKAAERMVYQIRFGDDVLGQYNTKTEATRELRTYRKEGLEVRIHTVYTIQPKEKRPRMRKRVEIGWWTGTVPFEISSEAARQLSENWRQIREVFYIGSYRENRPCAPQDRDMDLSLQPHGRDLALCCQTYPEGKKWLILGKIVELTVGPLHMEVLGTVEDGALMEYVFEIAGREEKHLPTHGHFEHGWYGLTAGALLYVGGRKREPTKEETDLGVAGIYRTMVVYPDTLSRKGYIARKGELPINDGETLDEAVLRSFHTGTSGHINVPDPGELADAFEFGRNDYIAKCLKTNRELCVFSLNRRKIPHFKQIAKNIFTLKKR